MRHVFSFALSLLFMASAAFILTTVAHAKPYMCTKAQIKAAAAKAVAHSGNDKNMHCTVSCMLTTRCSSSYVMMIGYMKELKDVFGPGDADAQDIKADKLGINLVLSKRADNDQECLEQCDSYYPR